MLRPPAAERTRQHAACGEHRPVELRFPLQGPGISPRRRGHAIETQGCGRPAQRPRFRPPEAPRSRPHGTACRWLSLPVVTTAQHCGMRSSSAARSVSRTTSRKLSDALSFQSDDLGRVVSRNAALRAERRDALAVERLAVRPQEMVAVAEKDVAHDPPHVVLQVGIEKSMLQRLRCGGKAAQHEQLGPRRKKGSSGCRSGIRGSREPRAVGLRAAAFRSGGTSHGAARRSLSLFIKSVRRN